MNGSSTSGVPTPTDEEGSDTTDFGFTYIVTKAGIVLISHHGKRVTELRGKAAQAFLKKTEQASDSERQQHLARVTGNYKRGNERLASNHPRNRR